jgi:hypothetical protein
VLRCVVEEIKMERKKDAVATLYSFWGSRSPLPYMHRSSSASVLFLWKASVNHRPLQSAYTTSAIPVAASARHAALLAAPRSGFPVLSLPRTVTFTGHSMN